MTPAQYAELLDMEEMDRIEKQLAAAKAANVKATYEPSTEGRIKAATSGAAEGLASTVGVAGDIDQLGKAIGTKVRSWLPEWAKPKDPDLVAKMETKSPPTTKDITGVIPSEYANYEPKDPTEEWIKRLVSGGSSAAAVPIRGMGWAARALTGMIGGGASEGAKQAGLPPAVQVAAGLVPWITTLPATMRKSNLQSMIEDSTNAVGEPAIRAAAAARDKHRGTMGEDFLLTQGFPEENALTGGARMLAAQPQGQRMQGILSRQGGSARDLVMSLIENMSRRDMGPGGANAAQAAGRRAQINARQDPAGPLTDELQSVFGNVPRPQRVPGTDPPRYTLPEPIGNYDRMAAGLNRNTPGGIQSVSRDLMGVDPEVMPSIIKSEFLGQVDRTQNSGNWMQALTDSLFGRVAGTPTRERFGEKIRQVYESQGRTPRAVNQYVQQATDLFEAIQAASRNRDFLGRVNETDMLQRSGRNLLSEAARSANIVAPTWRAGSAFERALSADTLRQFERALTQPGGEQILLDIARFGNLDHKAKQLVSSLLASRGSTVGAENEGDNPNLPFTLPTFGMSPGAK